MAASQNKIEDMVAFAAAGLEARADPDAAVAMAAYMKTDMPFYGVKKPGRTPVFKAMLERYPLGTPSEYESAVLALWARPHREEKYFAIGVARHFTEFVQLPQLPLYRRLIVEGAWWDFVDEVAAHLVGGLFYGHRCEMGPVMDDWITDDDMWIRRTAILSQLRHGDETDSERLFAYCRRCASEREFFIRKAIGWALRQYARSDPEAVRGFVADNDGSLSGLSKREALKHIG